MIRTTGRVVRHTSKIVHQILVAATGIVVAGSVLLAAAAWRLSQGPVQLVWLSDRLKSVLSDDDSPVHVTFDSVMLAWEGFQQGVDHPLDLRIGGITITSPDGRSLAAAPQAHVTLSLAGLIAGNVVPREIDIDRAAMSLIRGADTSIGFGPGTDDAAAGPDAPGGGLAGMWDQLAQPTGNDRTRTGHLLGQISRLRFRDAEIAFRDQATGAALRVTGLDLDVQRPHRGPIVASLQAVVQAGTERPHVSAHLTYTPGQGTELKLAVGPVRPAATGLLPPQIKATAPAGLEASAAFGPGFDLRQADAALQLGQGVLGSGIAELPIQSATVHMSGNLHRLVVQQARFDVSRPGPGLPEIIEFGATIDRDADRIRAALSATLDGIDMADLPRIWPLGVAVNVRRWMTENVSAGVVRHGAGSFNLESDSAFKDPVLTRATADLDGAGATFTWIDNVPPVQDADPHLHLADTDTLEINIPFARQRLRDGGPDLTLKNGQMRISGLSGKDQFAEISTEAEGPVLSVWSLLKEPRLHLLSAHPIGLKIGGGDVSATLSFQFPLEDKLQVDDVRIHAATQIKHAKIIGIAAGRDFEEGTLSLDADKDGLKASGTGLLAKIPVTVNAAMDFNSGPPDQIVQKISVSSRPDTGQLDAAGIAVADFVQGEVPLSAVLTERRNGTASVAIESDLTKARLNLAPLAWSKPAGAACSAAATILLVHDRVTKVDGIAVRGEDVSVAGSAAFTDGKIRTLLLDTIRLGRTSASGAAQFNGAAPIALALHGEQVDLGPKLTETSPAADTRETEGATTPPWMLDGHFTRALLAHDETASNVLIKAAGSGETINTLDVLGALKRAGGFAIRIEPAAGKRHLHIEAKDAGAFLSGADITRSMLGGQLTLDADFGRDTGYHPLTGQAELRDATAKNSPVLGKLLQAVTIYGLADALRGPGMQFSRILVPFRFDHRRITIGNARAYNASLGLTAKGTIGTAAEGAADISGTIVPAYAVNAALGRLPLVGRLFSPEVGGGIFAVRFGVNGPLSDPSVSINPVSAVTPGFLRDIFGVFDRAEAPAATPESR